MVRDGACFKCTYPLRIDLEQSLLYYVPGEIPVWLSTSICYISRSCPNPIQTLLSITSIRCCLKIGYLNIWCNLLHVIIYIYIIIIIFPIYIANFEVYFIFKQLSCGWETLSISLSSSLAPHLKIVLTVTMDTQNAKPLPPNQQTHKSIPFWYA